MKAFFAYPSRPAEVSQTIRLARQHVSNRPGAVEIHLWEENDISGRLLTDPIFQHIEASDFLFADITALNFNVTFEIGYAIGLGKRVILTRDRNFRNEADTITKIGIYDTLGYQEYANADELRAILEAATPDNPIPLHPIANSKAPLYVLETPTPNQAMLAIVARIKKARLSYRSFIPQEETRLSAIKAADDVSRSFGVIVPLLPPQYADADIHNIRGAFVAGLATGMRKVTLIVQPVDGPAPLDVRELVKSYRHPDDIGDFVTELALDVTERLQAEDPLPISQGNFIANLSIGDPTAENELQTLGSYYVRTDQFGRASRGEVNLVVGRKGAGKTALFSQLRNEKRSNIQNIVVDLKPQGYQLIRLKEDVLDFLAEGARTHLITAFFEYVLYLEICYKILEKDKERHLRDARLYDAYVHLEGIYANGAAGEGDFSERLLALSQTLAQSFKKKFGSASDQRLTAAEVTELVHKHNIRDIRDGLSAYLEFKKSVWVLFDNLDKGWSAHGLNDEDVLILRCLIEAARKIQREMQGDDHDFHCVVFVRNDVYQLLVESSSDYGKESRAVLDWTDSDLLREMLRRRLVSNGLPPETSFERVWGQVCLSHYAGEETSQYFIDRCLMRPRNFLKIFSHCLGFAINLGHQKVEDSDIEKGLRAYSLDLITEADQELTDILGDDTNLLYYFIGEGSAYDVSHLQRILHDAGFDAEKIESVVDFLLYYGFLGLEQTGDVTKYIYDVGYDMKLLRVLRSKAGDGARYTINPAFLPGLNT